MTSPGGDGSTLFAAYVIRAIPLLILFVYATRPFMTGVTRGMTRDPKPGRKR